MVRRTFLLCSTFVLFVATIAMDAQADQVRRGSRRATCQPGIQRAIVDQRTVKSVSRVRQIDGKSLWDLGMQKGQWPKLP